MNSSASTILLAAAKESEAANSAVVSVSTPWPSEYYVRRENYAFTDMYMSVAIEIKSNISCIIYHINQVYLVR